MAEQTTLFALDPGRAERRAHRRLTRKRTAEREKHPKVIPGFYGLIVECVTEHLRAGIEYDEPALVVAQQAAIAEMDPSERDRATAVGLDHPAMAKAIHPAVGRYLQEQRLRRERQRLAHHPLGSTLTTEVS